MDTHLIFLKLGGSLITNKSRPQSPRRALLRQIAEEIARTIADKPALRLVIGHGSGSYGHVSAREFGTRDGVQTPDQWHGFAPQPDRHPGIERCRASCHRLPAFR
jgi:isopentenyl phosphate kinase